MQSSSFLSRWQQRKRVQKIRTVVFGGLSALVFYFIFTRLASSFHHPASAILRPYEGVETTILRPYNDETNAIPIEQPADDFIEDPEEQHKFQEGVKTLEERRKITVEYCTSSKVFKDNGAWCLRDRTPPMEFAPGHRFSSQHVVADKHFVKELIKYVGDSHVVDLGAGLGQYGVRFSEFGRKGKYTAFDGAVNTEDFTNFYVQYADLTKPLYAPGDWVISFEVGEHIPKQHEQQYVENLIKNANVGLVLSWAIPKQGGHGHVNERTNEDLIQQVTAMGFTYDLQASQALRTQVFDRGSRHLRNTTMLFHRQQQLPGINTW